MDISRQRLFFAHQARVQHPFSFVIQLRQTVLTQECSFATLTLLVHAPTRFMSRYYVFCIILLHTMQKDKLL